MSSQKDVTQLLNAWANGDQSARDKLLSLIYPDLKRRARSLMRWERSDHTLQPTALIHEAYIRIVGEADTDWENREHFYKFATTVMRRILVDYARMRGADKREGSRKKLTLDELGLPAEEKDIDLLALDEALTQFEKVDPLRSGIVELRFFGGFSVEEVAELTRLSVATVKRYQRTALAWLRDSIENS